MFGMCGSTVKHLSTFVPERSTEVSRPLSTEETRWCSIRLLTFLRFARASRSRRVHRPATRATRSVTAPTMCGAERSSRRSPASIKSSKCWTERWSATTCTKRDGKVGGAGCVCMCV